MHLNSLYTILVVGQLDQINDRGSHESADIASRIETLENRFDDLQTRIRNELSTKPGITAKEVLSKITGLPLSLKKEYKSSIEKRIHGMRTETQIDDLFIVHLNPLSSFIDYGLIEYLIQKFGSEGLRKDMRSYCSEMVVFMKETTIKQLIETDCFPGQTEIPPKFSFIETKIGEDASKCTLEYLNRIRKRYCSEVKLSDIICHLVVVVESNSFIVKWLVPSALVDDIIKSTRNVNRSFYQEFKITSLTLDGWRLFISKAEIDAMWSRLHVIDTKFKDQFQTMYKQIVYELKVEQITEHQLSSYFKRSLKCHQSTSDWLSHELLNHKLPVSIVDFRVVAAAIEGFGSDCLKSVMNSYSNIMSIFLKKSTAQQLINFSAIHRQPSEYSIVKYTIRKNPSQYKLDKLFSFRTSFCMVTKISELYLVMDDVNSEMSCSFTVSWLVPSALISGIMKSSRNFDHSLYHRYSITSLTLDGLWLFLHEVQIDAMWSQVHVSNAKFKDQFHTMYKQIVYEMKVQNISKYHLSSYFQSLNYQQQISDQLSQTFLEEEFPASFVDFRVLKDVTEEFGSDCLKRVMESYCNYISIFTKESTAQHLVTLSALQSEHCKHFIAAKCTIMEEPSHCRVENLLQFRTRLCAITRFNEVCFIMDEVNMGVSGSFTVSWLLPSALVSDVIVKCARYVDQSFYQEFKITFLTLDGMWLFLSAAEIDTMWSKMRVSDTELSDQFHIMHKQVLCEVDGIGRSAATDMLSSYLMDQQPTLQKEVSVDISKAILSPNFPISLIDFRMCTVVIELLNFGSDCLKRVMESYCRFMSLFVEQSTLEQLVDLSVVQSEVPGDFLTAECKIKDETSEYRLEMLLKFQTKFCSMLNIDKVCFVMGEVRKKMSGSFTVSWHIPSAAVSYIVKFTSLRSIFHSFYQEYKITSLILDGMWIFLNDSEIDKMWLQVHPSDFESQFLTMYKQIVRELKAQDISENELSLYLMDQQRRLQSNASIQLSEAFLQHAFPFSVLNFRVLSIVIDKFGSDCLKSVKKSFHKYIMSFYTRESTVEQLVSLPCAPIQSSKYFISVKSRNREDPSDCTLARLLDFQARFCNIVNIDEVCFIMDKIEVETGGHDSFFIKWYVQSSLALQLLSSANQVDLEQTELFQKVNIPSLQLGDMWLYNYQLTPLGIQLRKRYQQSQGSPSPVEWIPSPTKKIFRLAMIQRERVQRGHIEDRFVQMTISGRVDDILHAKSPVELKHIFRNTLHGGEIILIEGAPGSGKSTLTVHICQRWGKGELFQQFTVVILVQLRDPAVQRAQTIADLLPVKNAEEIAAELIATNGRGVLWVVDGWDELPRHLQQESIFRKLIKRMLSECSVIVTSRPISSGDLHPVVSSRFEVLGFTPEEQRRYFTECFKGDTKALEALLEKIRENPMVQSICYLPLNAAFIVHTFKYRDQSLPNTEYEIHLSVILSCIQRHHDREGRVHDLPRELESLDDLSWSEAVREPFQCLCELAYRGVMENKVTFFSSDLPQGSNTLSLLQAIESFLQSGKSMFYIFLHLSVQEVLSAYYITTKLSDSEQVSQFQQLFNQPRFAAVFQFYAAITKLKRPGIRQVIDRIVEAKSKPLLVSLLRCLHEAQDLDLCLYVAEKLEYRLDLSEVSLSPLDCLSVSFFLSFLAGKEISFNLAQCQIGDLGAKCITKYLSMSNNTDLVTINLKGNDIHDEGASHVAKMLSFIEYLHLDVSENPIGVTGTSYMFQTVRESVILKTLILIGGTIIADLLPVKNAKEVATGLRATNRRGVLWILDDLQPHLHSIFLSPMRTTECSITIISHNIIDKIIKGNSKPLLVSLLRCLHEAQDPALCFYVAERLEYRLDFSKASLSPLDCLSVSFFLSSFYVKETSVNFYSCAIGDLGAKCLSKYLHADNNLDYVSKIAIDLTGNGIHGDGALHIARMIYYFEHLYLSHNPIGDTGASLISEAVRKTATLKTLNLFNCVITSRGAEDLSRSLAQNCSLEKLDIGSNNVGDEGISHVTKALKQNKQLKELWISSCGITDKGTVSLASALTGNNSLKMLCIGGSGDTLTEYGLSAIAHSLAKKSLFMKLAIPHNFGSTLLSWNVNEAREKNGLPPIEIKGEYIVWTVFQNLCLLATFS